MKSRFAVIAFAALCAASAPIASFAYPCGGENDDIVAEVVAAGYRFAAAMVKKMRPVGTDPYRIHRQIIPRGMKTWQAYLLATRGKYKI